jgi:hypothetical protein
MARAPKKPPRERLSWEQANEAIGRLCDHYGVARNKANALYAVVRAISDGLIKVPSNLRGRGRPPKWVEGGTLGRELVDEVEEIRSQWRPGLRKPSTARIIRALQEHRPKKWGQYPDLVDRYYEARRYWTHYKRLAATFAETKTPRK